MNRQDFEQQFTSISDQIWEFAEPRYQEFHSSALQADFLEQEGFTVTRNLGGHCHRLFCKLWLRSPGHRTFRGI